MPISIKKNNTLHHGLFINGRWVESSTNKVLCVIEPSTGREYAYIARGNAIDVDKAVNAARQAFEDQWSKMDASQRGILLSKLSKKISEHHEEIAQIDAKDTGKTISQSRTDVSAALKYFAYYGGAADKIHGETIPFQQGYFVAVVHEPLGVTGHILPWNYPAQMFGRSLGPSLAAGNTVVLKPAEDACLSILRMTELADEVGFPAGVINVVSGLGNEAGVALAGHSGINFLSFTGSPEVGTKVQELTAANHIGCTLELGGKSPQIIFDDADIESALASVINGIVQNSGQTCSAGSRVLIQKSIYKQFVAQLVLRFSKLKVGSHDMDLDCGALISERQKVRVMRIIEEAEQDGATLLAEGQIAEEVSGGGFYVKPKLFGEIERDNKLAREEIFGPVLIVFPFEDEKDAIQLANGTDYGLVSAVWTKDGSRQMRMAKSLSCGQVFINCFGAGGGVELPFGGVKKSGHGREKGLAAIYEYCTLKTIICNHD